MSRVENPLEFETVYRIDRFGKVTQDHGHVYVPTVEHDNTHDVLIDGAPDDHRSRWHALVDHSGQHNYHGAVMHPSEYWGDWATEDLAEKSENAEREVLFVLTEVRTDDGDDEPAGWAVIYRPI